MKSTDVVSVHSETYEGKTPIVVELWIAAHGLEKTFAYLHSQDSGCLLCLHLLFFWFWI